ncbi:hypothetical protein GA0074695_1859 [Micromonospora viridifaciens]|uniref:Zinc-ribbon 15 domain-containing protein n=1 Tax=Micromonospora viridifaciens TaxID=1881 RepID=A0A1C4VWC0_MICVI|nr:hypothetical protein GA0074695_1859 [Micromonospora viridifaciens]
MFIVFGWRTAARRVAMLSLLCHVCRQQAAHPLDKLTKKFTLFFIPVLPLSTTYQLTCVACGTSQPVMKDAAEQLIAHPDSFTTAAAALGDPPVPTV